MAAGSSAVGVEGDMSDAKVVCWCVQGFTLNRSVRKCTLTVISLVVVAMFYMMRRSHSM